LAAALLGAITATGARSTDIVSMTDRAGMAVAATSVRSAMSFSAISLCSFLRRSTIEKKARIAGLRPANSSTNSDSWSRVRTDSVVGISGTTMTSAACSTFSETSETDGGQSRNTASYSLASGASSRPSLRAGLPPGASPGLPSPESSSRSMFR
jgi:hypothetical protein